MLKYVFSLPRSELKKQREIWLDFCLFWVFHEILWFLKNKEKKERSKIYEAIKIWYFLKENNS